MWRRWTCWLAAVLLISACSHATLTRVVRTDGSEVVGELVAARPDAVVLKLADGSTITIPRSIISTVEAAQTPTSASGKTAAGGSPTTPTPSAPASTPTHTSTPTAPATPQPRVTPTPSAPTPSGPTAPAAPRVARELVAPTGSTLELSLSAPIGSDTSKIDDKVDAALRAPLIVNGESVLGAGAVAHGVITEATPSGNADGRGRLAVRFDTIQLGARTVSIQTAPLRWEAPGVSKAPPPRPPDKSFFHRVVDKTRKGLHLKDDEPGPRGSADVRFAAGALLRIRLEQPAHLAP
jgi:hypothetical protein